MLRDTRSGPIGGLIASAQTLARKLRHRWFLRAIRRSSVRSTAVAGEGAAIDVVIPVIDRDLPMLPLVVEGVRRNAAHPIGSVILVGPPTPGILAAACSMGCRFVAEDDVLTVKRREVAFRPNGVDRSGWIFQQLLKLAADTFCASDNMLVLDADTVLIRRQAFLTDGRPIFRISDELHLPYFVNMRRVLGRGVRARFSHVAHHMLFQRATLVALRAQIERVGGRPWISAILASLDPNELSGFSEYETYGAVAAVRDPPPVLEYWHNCALAEQPATLDEMEHRYASQYSTVSIHWHMAQRA